MEAPILTSNPNVNEYDGRSFTFKNPSNNTEKTLTFKQAFADRRLRKKALSFYSNPTPKSSEIPFEFTQYVLRSLAVAERGCRHFEKKLDRDVRNYLKEIIGRTDSDIQINRVHNASTNTPSGFRGIFVKYFFKKVIYNLRNEVGRYEYSENFVSIFPFQVLDRVPVEYAIEVENFLDDDFYTQIQGFLNDHFESTDARQVGPLYLANIHHFRATRVSEEDLIERVLRKPKNDDDGGSKNGYFSSFPRLNENGIGWLKSLYLHYKNVRKVFDEVDVSTDIYDRNYFETLPESNFADLYELLNTSFYKSRREKYIERFEKYLFFFVHALKEQPNPVFFIDDVLFECLKSLHRFKTSREDLSLVSDIAKLSLVHLRTKFQTELSNFDNIYAVESEFLKGIKDYVQNIPNIETAQIDVEYKTDYLYGWVLLRNNDTCYEMCYSKRQRRHITDFIDRILCSVLSPDTEQIKKVVIYNSFTGEESCLAMPQDIQAIRNFIRLSNKYDFKNDALAESNDEFLTRGVEAYFHHLTVAE